MSEINRVLVDRAQGALSAGANISINPVTNVIAATNTTYVAGTGIASN